MLGNICLESAEVPSHVDAQRPVGIEHLHDAVTDILQEVGFEATFWVVVMQVSNYLGSIYALVTC